MPTDIPDASGYVVPPDLEARLRNHLPRLYTHGKLSTYQIAKVTGLTQKKVVKLLREERVPMGQYRNHTVPAEAVARVEAGERLSVVARDYGFSYGALRRHLRKKGYVHKTQSTWSKVCSSGVSS